MVIANNTTPNHNKKHKTQLECVNATITPYSEKFVTFQLGSGDVYHILEWKSLTFSFNPCGSPILFECNQHTGLPKNEIVISHYIFRVYPFDYHQFEGNLIVSTDAIRFYIPKASMSRYKCPRSMENDWIMKARIIEGRVFESGWEHHIVHQIGM